MQRLRKLFSKKISIDERIQSSIDTIGLFYDFETYVEAINELDNLLVNLPDDEINKRMNDIAKAVYSRVRSKYLLVNIRDQIIKMFEVLFIHYMNYLSTDTIDNCIIYFDILLTSVIDYRPEIAHEIFNKHIYSIESLLRLELYKYREYYPWFEQYLPVLIKEYNLVIDNVKRDYDAAIKLLDTKTHALRDPSKLTQGDNKDFLIIFNKKRIIQQNKKSIKRAYYILAQVKSDQPKSDVDKEWIIRYLIRADEYLDAPTLRTSLFREYYIGNMESITIPINGDEDTIIQFGNYIKNKCH